jgi:hypothetical protein
MCEDTGTKVIVDGGWISGGSCGVAVQAGGRLEATALSINQASEVGFLAEWEGSSMALTSC